MVITSVPELFAMAAGVTCAGNDKCHWCFAACERRIDHDDPYPKKFDRTQSTSKNPQGGFMCKGCQLFRRTPLTGFYVDGTCKDRLKAREHSWLIERDRLWVVWKDMVLESEKNANGIYNKLLKPVAPFSLVLKTNKDDLQIHNAVFNAPESFTVSTPLVYHLDGKKLEYSVYELDLALKQGTEGKSPGVRMLIEYFGDYRIPVEDETRPAMTGRPKPPENATKTLSQPVSKKK